MKENKYKKKQKVEKYLKSSISSISNKTRERINVVKRSHITLKERNQIKIKLMEMDMN